MKALQRHVLLTAPILLVLTGLLPAQASPTPPPQILLDGQQGGPILVSPEAVAVLDVLGPSSVPFALMLSPEPMQLATAFGTLGINPLAAWAFFLFNGYDQNHFNYGTSFLPSTGVFTAFVIPFQEPYENIWPSVYAQAYATDPAAAAGASLSNTLLVRMTPNPPAVSSTDPNYAAALAPLLILGSGFDPSPSQNQVSVDGYPCQVTSGDPHYLQVLLPEEARSGPVRVANLNGSGGGSTNALEGWCAVVTSPFAEAGAPAQITSRTCIIGQIQTPGERDQFAVLARAGEEIYAEVYSWDPMTSLITGAANSSNAYFDPVVRVIAGTVPVCQDDDSGPLLNAGIGLTNGQSNFVADQTGTYHIEVDTYLSLGSGHYLLVVGVRTPEVLPLMVQSVHPNIARPGDTVSLFATGIEGTSTAGYSILLRGESIPPLLAFPGRLDFVVPAEAVSGPLNIATPVGVTTHGLDRMASWLCVVSPNMTMETEGTPQLLAPGDAVLGAIQPAGDVDIFPFSAQAGHAYQVECYAFDATISRAVTSSFLAWTPLDPDVRITPHGVTTPYLAINGNGGPGFNALIGSPGESPSFVAPNTTTYDIQVLPWFGISRGPYLLRVVDVTP